MTPSFSAFTHLGSKHRCSCFTSEAIGWDICLQLHPFPAAAVHLCFGEVLMLQKHLQCNREETFTGNDLDETADLSHNQRDRSSCCDEKGRLDCFKFNLLSALQRLLLLGFLFSVTTWMLFHIGCIPPSLHQQVIIKLLHLLIWTGGFVVIAQSLLVRVSYVKVGPGKSWIVHRKTFSFAPTRNTSTVLDCGAAALRPSLPLQSLHHLWIIIMIDSLNDNLHFKLY